MAIAWPATVSQRVRTGTLTETPEDNVDAFSVRTGPAKRSRYSTLQTWDMSFQSCHLTKDEAGILVDWYTNDLDAGTLEFTRTHPRTGVNGMFEFIDPPEPRYVTTGEVNGVKVDYYTVMYHLRHLPS